MVKDFPRQAVQADCWGLLFDAAVSPHTEEDKKAHRPNKRLPDPSAAPENDSHTCFADIFML